MLPSVTDHGRRRCRQLFFFFIASLPLALDLAVGGGRQEAVRVDVGDRGRLRSACRGRDGIDRALQRAAGVAELRPCSLVRREDEVLREAKAQQLEFSLSERGALRRISIVPFGSAMASFSPLFTARAKACTVFGFCSMKLFELRNARP